jgi:hypothetical protein
LYFWLHTFKPNINKYLEIFTNFLPHFWLLQTSKITSFSLNFEFCPNFTNSKKTTTLSLSYLIIIINFSLILVISPSWIIIINFFFSQILVIIIIFCSLSSSSHPHPHPHHLIIVPTNVLVQCFLFQSCDVTQETNIHKHI